MRLRLVRIILRVVSALTEGHSPEDSLHAALREQSAFIFARARLRLVRPILRVVPAMTEGAQPLRYPTQGTAPREHRQAWGALRAASLPRWRGSPENPFGAGVGPASRHPFLAVAPVASLCDPRLCPRHD
ncbi:MAG: hypothetical protein SF053_03045 [Bacteroidia bacterium]|nr:hypothetical protein [Bacteroidia bacterium]